MIVFIRVDSGEAIGTGHIMRCLTLSDRISKKIPKENIIFLSKPHNKNIISKISDYGYKVEILSEPEFQGSIDEKTWLGTSIEADANEVSSIIQNYHSQNKILIIDHYSLDISWEKILRSDVQKIILIDDLANRSHDCDVLLDQNFYLDKESRYTNLVSPQTKLLLGPQYALLRDDFYDYAKNYKFSADIHNLFVYFGGIDAAGMTLKTAQALINYPHITSHIIANPICRDYEEIKNICQKYPHFKFYSEVKNMAEMMASCDAAIGAGGTTTWERGILGIPSLVFSIANNQKKICEDMHSISAIIHHTADSIGEKDIISNIIKEFLDNPKKRELLHVNSLSLMKKNNIVPLEDYIDNDNFSFRALSIDDIDSLFEWRNKDFIRNAMKNSDKIQYENHKKWFSKITTSQKDKYYIACSGKDEIGLFYFNDIKEESSEWGFYLNSNSLPKGTGFKLCKFGLLFGKSALKLKKIKASVKKDNVASLKIHERLGFTLHKKGDDIYEYTKEICYSNI